MAAPAVKAAVAAHPMVATKAPPTAASQVNLTISELVALCLFAEYIQEPQAKAAILAKLKEAGAETKALDLSHIAFRILVTGATEQKRYAPTQRAYFLEGQISKLIKDFFPKLTQLYVPLGISKRIIDMDKHYTGSQCYYDITDREILYDVFKSRKIQFFRSYRLAQEPDADEQAAKAMIQFRPKSSAGAIRHPSYDSLPPAGTLSMTRDSNCVFSVSADCSEVNGATSPFQPPYDWGWWESMAKQVEANATVTSGTNTAAAAKK